MQTLPRLHDHGLWKGVPQVPGLHRSQGLSGVSSVHFDVAVGDLSGYKEVVEKIRNLAIEINMALDELPQDAQQRSNPRYGKARLDQDMDNEDLQLSNEETILRNHQVLREHLDEVRDDDRPGGDDPDEPPNGHPGTRIWRRKPVKSEESFGGFVSRNLLQLWFLQDLALLRVPGWEDM